MAIAAIVLHLAGSPQEPETALRAMPEMVEAAFVPPDKLAATLECPSETMLACLQKAANLPNVWNLELVYVNYEDDLDENGHMKAPPFEDISKKKQ